MADKAAGPERSGDNVSPGKERDSPEQATAAGQARSRDSADQRDAADSADEVRPKFREALESGPATPMTQEDWAALRAQALEGLAGEAIRP